MGRGWTSSTWIEKNNSSEERQKIQGSAICSICSSFSNCNPSRCCPFIMPSIQTVLSSTTIPSILRCSTHLLCLQSLVLRAAELEGQHCLENLPEQFSSSLRGIVTTFALENQKLNHVLQEHTDMLKTMETHFMAKEMSNEARPWKRRKGTN